MSVLGMLVKTGKRTIQCKCFAELANELQFKGSGKQLRKELDALTRKNDPLISLKSFERREHDRGTEPANYGHIVTIPEDVAEFVVRLRAIDHIGFCPGEDRVARVNEVFGPGGWDMFTRMRRLGQLQEQKIEIDGGGIYTMYVIP